jgi:hypothetical protein
LPIEPPKIDTIRARIVAKFSAGMAAWLILLPLVGESIVR